MCELFGIPNATNGKADLWLAAHLTKNLTGFKLRGGNDGTFLQ